MLSSCKEKLSEMEYIVAEGSFLNLQTHTCYYKPDCYFYKASILHISFLRNVWNAKVKWTLLKLIQFRKRLKYIKLSISEKTCVKKSSLCTLAPGLPIPVIWTRLAQTAKAGESTLILQEAVTWKPGDTIVIASTGHRYDVFWAW